MTISLTQRDFATGAAVRKMNALAQAISDLVADEVGDDAAISSISSGLSGTNSTVSQVSSGLSDVSSGLSSTQSVVSSVSSGLSDINVIPPGNANINPFYLYANTSAPLDVVSLVPVGTLKLDPTSVKMLATTDNEVVSEDGKTLTCTGTGGSTQTYVVDPVTGVITITQSGIIEQLGFAPAYSIADTDGNAVIGNIYTTIVIVPALPTLTEAITAGQTIQVDVIANAIKGTFDLDPTSVVFFDQGPETGGNIHDTLSNGGKTLHQDQVFSPDGSGINCNADLSTGVITIACDVSVTNLYQVGYCIADVQGNQVKGILEFNLTPAA